MHDDINMITKSRNSLSTAKFLKDEDVCFYSTSVHCCYYSCIQIIIHILEQHGITESIVKINSKASSKGPHEYMINEINKYLYLCNTPSVELLKCISSIKELKKNRIKADYRTVVFDKNETSRLIELSESVLELLYNKFNI